MKKLENIKVGDEVVVYGGWQKRIRKVEKITPSGLIKVGGNLYYDSGSQRGGDIWSKTSISFATPEIKQQIAEETAIRKARNLLSNYAVKDYEIAVKIIELLGGEE